jgi:hypothetical protein
METKGHVVYRTADGNIVQGVTSIIGLLAKPELVPWANKLGLEGVKASKYVAWTAEIGKYVHGMIEQNLSGRDVISPSEIAPGDLLIAEMSYDAFLHWRASRSITGAQNELVLVSEEFRYGGTIDLFASIDNRWTLVDFKTSNRLYPTNIIQLAAYKQLLVENHHLVEEAGILHLPRGKEGVVTYTTFTDLEPYFEAFKLLRSLSDYKDLLHTMPD